MRMYLVKATRADVEEDGILPAANALQLLCVSQTEVHPRSVTCVTRALDKATYTTSQASATGRVVLARVIASCQRP